VTVPNGVSPRVRRRLADLKSEGLVALNAEILRRAKRILSLGAWVQAEALQRHYLGQRSPAITDARLSFKLETSQPRRRDRVKRQPGWIELFAELLRRKRSNIQFAYALYLPWRTKGIASRESLRLIAESWLAMKPLLDVVRSPGHGAR
jgi:hypothetical protein